MRRWLLIGNSRWHWAAPAPDQSLQLWHTSAADGAEQLQQAPAAWAAVGPVPKELERWQPQRLLTVMCPWPSFRRRWAWIVPWRLGALGSGSVNRCWWRMRARL